MRQIPTKIKPKAGFAHFIHIAFTCLLPLILFILVRLRFYHLPLGIALIVLSKWRMFAVKPRHWPANIRANAVDIAVGLSALVFMIHSSSSIIQLFWAVAYGAWLLVLKPQSSDLGVTLQALVAQSAGITALFLIGDDAPLYVLVVGSWLVSHIAARHYFTNFEEPMVRYLSAAWAYVSAALVWVLGHWLLFYGPIAQPALLISVISFGLGGMYYLEKSDRTSVALRRQLLFVLIAVTMIVLASLVWGDRAIK